MKNNALILVVTLGVAGVVHAAEPKLTTVTANGKGRLTVNIVYFAEDTCMQMVSVREGHPPSIEKPKRTPVVTVELSRQGTVCEQRLRTLERSIDIADLPGAKSVEVFYINAGGKFIRSTRPTIDRPEDQSEMQ